jgi:hypothetical protein
VKINYQSDNLHNPANRKMENIFDKSRMMPSLIKFWIGHILGAIPNQIIVFTI